MDQKPEFVQRPTAKPAPIKPLQGSRAAALPEPATVWRGPSSEECFDNEFWRYPLGWPDDAAPVRPGGPYGVGVAVQFVFLARAVDRLAQVAPPPHTGNAARLWAARLIVEKRLQGDLRTCCRRGREWIDIGDKSWRYRADLGEMDMFASGRVLGDRDGDFWVYVGARGLARLIERATDEYPPSGEQPIVPDEDDLRAALADRFQSIGVLSQADAWELACKGGFDNIGRKRVRALTKEITGNRRVGRIAGATELRIIERRKRAGNGPETGRE